MRPLRTPGSMSFEFCEALSAGDEAAILIDAVDYYATKKHLNVFDVIV